MRHKITINDEPISFEEVCTIGDALLALIETRQRALLRYDVGTDEWHGATARVAAAHDLLDRINAAGNWVNRPLRDTLKPAARRRTRTSVPSTRDGA